MTDHTALQSRELVIAHRLRIPVRPAIVAAIAAGTLRSTVALEAARSWWKHRGTQPVFVLLGGTGSGKTVAAADRVFAQEALNGGAAYVLADELCRLRGSSPSRFGELARADLLVVDEIGTEGDPLVLGHAIHEIVDMRVQGAAAAMLLSHLAWPELRDRLHPRTVDRLREVAIVVETDEPSMRGGPTP